jgi:dethiobiotin synthetase
VSTVVVAGTGTEVGKTWWACATLACLRDDGVAVAARKPAQSFSTAELGSTDAELLGAASGEAPDVVCARHRWYEVPMAPPMAADALGRPPFTVADLVADLAPAPARALRFVEGAGGPRSPIAADGDNVDLAAALAPAAVVLVGDAGLGTINAVRLGADAFAGVAGGRLVVALNRYDAGDDLHRRNRDWLAAAGFVLVTSPADLARWLRGIS